VDAALPDAARDLGGTPADVGRGAPDAVPGDARAAGAGCGDRSVFVCDDFEKGTDGMAPGAPWSARGAVVTSARAASGSRSVVTKKGQALRFNFPTAMRPDVVWGRVMFWADDTPNNHWSFIMAERRDGHLFRLGQQRTEGKQLMTNYGWPGSARENVSRTEKFPLKAWACFEWHFDRVAKISELWVDGKLIAGASGKLNFGPAVPGPWEWMAIGQSTFHPEAGNPMVWIDDLAIGTKRIGCPVRLPSP
jgi:hypothetical protein